MKDAKASGGYEEHERLLGELVSIEALVRQNERKRKARKSKRGSTEQIKASKSVEKNIRKALDVIQEDFPTIAKHLKSSIGRIDYQFSYTPPDDDLRFAVEWVSPTKKHQ